MPCFSCPDTAGQVLAKWTVDAAALRGAEYNDVKMKPISPIVATGRRFRFRLRTLLLALTVACFIFAWVYRAREQHTAVSAMRQANPGVTFRYDDDEVRGAFARWAARWLGADYVADVEKVELFYATDADLACVARLREVQWLSLLRSIDLTDAGLAHLSSLENLQTLQISEAEQLTDAGIAHLQRLKSLKILRLDLGRASVSPQAIERLRRALPNCRIEVGPGEAFAGATAGSSSSVPSEAPNASRFRAGHESLVRSIDGIIAVGELLNDAAS